MFKPDTKLMQQKYFGSVNVENHSSHLSRHTPMFELKQAQGNQPVYFYIPLPVRLVTHCF